MKIEISNGELLDKLSILNIKLNKITDKNKLINITKEQSYIKQICKNLFESIDICQLFEILCDINLELWNIEDAIRNKERHQTFDEEFIVLARNVYIKNDARAKIKKEINVLTESHFVEEKSYEKY